MAKTQIRESVKFRMLVRLMRMPRAHVLGHLEFMWMTIHDSGNPVFSLKKHIEVAADWEGPHDEFADLLIEVGFLDKLPDNKGFEVHDYWENCPKYVKDRERQRAIRSQKSATPREKSADVSENTPLTQPNPTQPIQDPDPERGGSDISIEYILKNGETWKLTSARAQREYLREFSDALGGDEAVIDELNAARRWCVANDSKRKTARGMPKFLTSWLQRTTKQLRKDAAAQPDPDAAQHTLECAEAEHEQREREEREAALVDGVDKEYEQAKAADQQRRQKLGRGA